MVGVADRRPGRLILRRERVGDVRAIVARVWIAVAVRVGRTEAAITGDIPTVAHIPDPVLVQVVLRLVVDVRAIVLGVGDPVPVLIEEPMDVGDRASATERLEVIAEVLEDEVRGELRLDVGERRRGRVDDLTVSDGGSLEPCKLVRPCLFTACEDFTTRSIRSGIRLEPTSGRIIEARLTFPPGSGITLTLDAAVMPWQDDVSGKHAPRDPQRGLGGGLEKTPKELALQPGTAAFRRSQADTLRRGTL